MATVLYLVHHDTLLQNATDIIIKYDSYFITNYDKSLLQNAPKFFITKCDIFLQNTQVITKCVNLISKRGSYYKTWRLLQNVSVHTFFHFEQVIDVFLVFLPARWRCFLFVERFWQHLFKTFLKNSCSKFRKPYQNHRTQSFYPDKVFQIFSLWCFYFVW